MGNKKNKLWIWTVVNHKRKGILLWNIGDRSSKTFEPIWQIIKCWTALMRHRLALQDWRGFRLACFWYVTDGWKVYPMYIKPEDHLICKTYMTLVQRRLVRCM